ncbi:MAG: glucosamine--fructose-6-phosphate aminotransferase, partial [Armatimonadota bacterium]
MHHMFQEILQQPAVVANLLDHQQAAAREVARLVEARQITQIVLAARGTSDHAAVYGQYLFQIQNHLAAFL